MSQAAKTPPNIPTSEYYENEDNNKEWSTAIVARMMGLYDVKKMAVLSRELGHKNPKKVAMWIYHGTIPDKTIRACALKFGVSLDYLYFGSDVSFALTGAAKENLQQQFTTVLLSGEKTRLIKEQQPNGINALSRALADEAAEFLNSNTGIKRLEK